MDVETDESVFDFSQSLDLQDMVDEFMKTKFFKNFLVKLLCALDIINKNCKATSEKNITSPALNDDQALDLVCYGLGNFMSSKTSRYQLAFLIILKKILSPRTVSIFDPAFTTKEKCILEDFGMDVINFNEYGKRTVWNRTIFFMPHCPRRLYNNLLWANWEKRCLSNLLVIGDSFEGIEMNMEDEKYIISASKFVTKTTIGNFTYLELEPLMMVEVFYSLSVFYFDVDALCAVPFEVWDENGEPVFSKDKAKCGNICGPCKRFDIE